MIVCRRHGLLVSCTVLGVSSTGALSAVLLLTVSAAAPAISRRPVGCDALVSPWVRVSEGRIVHVANADTEERLHKVGVCTIFGCPQ